MMMFELKRMREAMLTGTDWTQIPDSPLNDSQKSAWAIYRQQLRDLPEQYENETDINNVVFPAPPTS